MTAGASRFVTAQDGLRLHVRDFDPPAADALPAVCLPGLSRTADDFDVLAAALAEGRHGPPRRVLAIDYRGRGLSAWDADTRNYDLRVESGDIASVLTASSVTRAVFVGTSRGGLHAMLMSALRPALIAGAVLNDIGPVIAAEGLARIKGYIGKLPKPADWSEAVATLKRIGGAHFTGLSEDDWLRYAELTFKLDGGVLSARYDPGLMDNLARLDLDAIPELWPQFDGLQHVPLLVIRGANSDLLSAETAAAMVARHPDATLVTVAGQGHAPLLLDSPTVEAICRFAARCDDAASEGVGTGADSAASGPNTRG